MFMLGRSAMSAATGSASGRPDRRSGCRSVGGRRFLRSQCRWPGCLKGRAEADPASGSADTIRVGGWPVDSNGGRRSPRASARRDAGLRRRIACSGTSMCQPWGRHLGWALKPVGRVGGCGPVLGAADHQLRGMRRWPWRFAGMKRRRGSSGRGRVRAIYNSESWNLHNVDYRHFGWLRKGRHGPVSARSSRPVPPGASRRAGPDPLGASDPCCRGRRRSRPRSARRHTDPTGGPAPGVHTRTSASDHRIRTLYRLPPRVPAASLHGYETSL